MPCKCYIVYIVPCPWFVFFFFGYLSNAWHIVCCLQILEHAVTRNVNFGLLIWCGCIMNNRLNCCFFSHSVLYWIFANVCISCFEYLAVAPIHAPEWPNCKDIWLLQVGDGLCSGLSVFLTIFLALIVRPYDGKIFKKGSHASLGLNNSTIVVWKKFNLTHGN